ncbi:MAG: ATP phosphoribosyltransferase [Phycisphaerales bacterium]|nr:ATP phosphoribosyltransferase [Phycisphaerales bacterium]
MQSQQPNEAIRFAIPKGRMYDAVVRLLRDAGVGVGATSRDYRPSIGLDMFEAKILKPRAIVEMLARGERDVGFAGADWVAELDADLVELLDTGLDPVRLVAAAPVSILSGDALPRRSLVVASEYVRLAERWTAAQGIDARVMPSYGATEVLPPEDADCIIDNTATGATLAANGLRIIDELMVSTTRLYASCRAMDDPRKRERIDRLVMLIGSVLEARRRVMVEVNVPRDRLADVVEVLPCMREPTVAPLRGDVGYAVKAAVLRDQLASVIPAIKSRGGTDVIVTIPEQIVL